MAETNNTMKAINDKVMGMLSLQIAMNSLDWIKVDYSGAWDRFEERCYCIPFLCKADRINDLREVLYEAAEQLYLEPKVMHYFVELEVLWVPGLHKTRLLPIDGWLPLLLKVNYEGWEIADFEGVDEDEEPPMVPVEVMQLLADTFRKGAT